MLTNHWVKSLNIQYPVIQAPMAGGVTTPKLTAEVSNAGGLGTIGAGYMTPDELRKCIQSVRSLTKMPFGVNLFIPQSGGVKTSRAALQRDKSPSEDMAYSDTDIVLDMNRKLDSYRRELGIPENPSRDFHGDSFEKQLEVVLAERVKVFTFTFGVPSLEVVRNFKQQGTYVMGTATTVPEALYLEKHEVDAIIAQGSEAGGHRGTFLHASETPLIGTLALIPQVVDAVNIPVIAAGGVMDGRGLAACLMLGAVAVQMGSAFIACTESGAHELYKKALLKAEAHQVAMTTAYSGKAARGIKTKFMNDMCEYRGEVPPYPVQNTLTMDIRQAAAQQGNQNYMSLWAGQGVGMAQRIGAGELLEHTVSQATKLLRNTRQFGESV